MVLYGRALKTLILVYKRKQVVLQWHWHARSYVSNLVTDIKVVIVASLAIARKKYV